MLFFSTKPWQLITTLEVTYNHFNKKYNFNNFWRQSIFNSLGKNKLVLSNDVSQLNLIDGIEVLKLVKEFKTFTKDDDPYGEHDFGSFDFKDISYFWKIDYYDNDLKFHSEDKLNAEKTIKVLTVLRASEY